ncbi:MAG: FHA domain-containing protein, partial [Thermoleophilia bacterium]|nr:FHA domain-containing protein [Thermoleophilia bacterium]
MSTPDVLVVTAGAEEGMHLALPSEGLTLGRDPEQVDAVLTDPRVSRRHARIWNDRGVLMVEDLGSTGGTLLNAEPIDRAMPLRRGDVIGLGATTLTVAWVPAPAATVIGTVPPELRSGAGEPGDTDGAALWPHRGSAPVTPPAPAPAESSTQAAWPPPPVAPPAGAGPVAEPESASEPVVEP